MYFACRGTLSWEKELLKKMDGKIRVELANLLKDGLIEVDKKALYVTEMGRHLSGTSAWLLTKEKESRQVGINLNLAKRFDLIRN